MKKLFIYVIIALLVMNFVYADNQSFYDRVTTSLNRDFGDIELYFCEYNDCQKGLIDIINNSEKVVCAFYDLNLEKLIEVLDSKDTILVLDKKLKDKNYLENSSMQIHYKEQSAYMHHKFCVLDNKKVLTGSMNPTKFGTSRNNNNFFLIESEILVKNYLNEINFLLGKETNKTENIFIMNNFIMENYLCPRDCKSGGTNRFVSLVDSSQKTIDIAAFSFTSEELFTAILGAHERGVEVRIILEKRLINTKGSKFKVLQELGIEIIFDNNPGSMHHKFIIIDGAVVQTGSMNYSTNGLTKNNENFFIIYNPAIANAFTQEFERMWVRFS